MPTGYTSEIADGISFKRFVLNCARAFGACVTLRDDPGRGESIPEKFEPSDYHSKALSDSRSELQSVAHMTHEECERAANKAFDDEETRRAMRIKEMDDLRVKYESMLSQVDAWRPPSPDHSGLKQFMRDQITQSMSHDCDTTYYSKPVKRLTGAEWKVQRIDATKKNIEYHSKHHIEELKRIDSRNEWIKALRESLEVAADRRRGL